MITIILRLLPPTITQLFVDVVVDTNFFIFFFRQRVFPRLWAWTKCRRSINKAAALPLQSRCLFMLFGSASMRLALTKYYGLLKPTSVAVKSLLPFSMTISYSYCSPFSSVKLFQKNYTILRARLLAAAFAALLAALRRSSLYGAVRRKENRPFSTSNSIQPVSGSASVCWQIAG